MEVDKTGGSDSAAAQRIAQKKQQQEIEEQRVQLEIGRVQRERQRAVEAEKEKGDRELVEISRQASNQMDNARKLNTERVHALSENQQKSYETLAAKTAEEIQRADTDAAKTIEAHKFGSLERIKQVTNLGEDPFYQLKSLDPVLSENESAYTVQVKLPEHEAKNLFVSGEGPYLKLALARRFQDNAKAPESKRTTTTNSYQSVVEQIAMPGAYDAKKIERSYADGMVTLKVPKLIFGANAEKIKA
jgi:HSP20 family molecular chaperone IbpA